MPTERICIETRGYTGANLGKSWGGDGRRTVPCPSLDELEADVDERDEASDAADEGVES